MSEIYRNIKSFSLLLIISFLILSCNNQENHGKGKIMLSFDDQYISNWHSYRDIFKEYDAKVIFYVTRPAELSPDELKMLRDLQSDGHMIGSHGMNHKHVSDYKSAQIYYEEEVLPAVRFFKKHGIKISSYAYPYGKGRKDTDSLLISNDLSVRYADWNWEHDMLHKIDRFYVNQSKEAKKFTAVGIDENYRIGRMDLVFGLKRTQENNSIIILHAHKISKKNTDYKLHPGKLKFLLKQCKKRGIEFYLP